jgi:tRNA(Ile2) C34 agmatinyltransferase TiaS
MTPGLAQDEQGKCSRCTGLLDTDGSPPWCKKCRAKYQRDYKALRAEMTESRGYAAGISAMRDHLAKAFYSLGPGAFTGYEAAALIRQAKGPVSVVEAPGV